MSHPRGQFFGLDKFDPEFIDGKDWKLHNPGGVFGYALVGGERISPPDGFPFDFASIPRVAWRVIGPPSGYGHGANYGPAAAIHDYLYETAKVNGEWIGRSTADWILLDAMVQLEVHWWRRNLMWECVRVGGVSHWQKHRKADGRPRRLAYI
jgi:hypothetical protein